ncbi:MAG: DNA modification methylase [candidate division Zixibacteria bacterium]|nr:DNA modification methylase [candidate division Zixibacteria bacterium]
MKKTAKISKMADARDSSSMKVEQIPVEKLKPNTRNPRVNDDAVDAVARSIQTYGFNNPIITDVDLNIAAGHTRLKAAKRLGLKVVPVIRVPGLIGSKFTGFVIADNKTAEIAEWDQELLNRLVAELNTDVDFDLGSLGFDDAELTKILDESCDFEDDKEDQAPPLPANPVTNIGDLWTLGGHRLLCGDATKVDDLLKLTAGQKIDSLVTDPPYGVSYHSRGQKRDEWGDIKNDDLDLASLEEFLRIVFQNVAQICRTGATAYVFHGISGAGIRVAFERAFLSVGFHLSSTIIWVKQAASMGWQDYREQHEAILYGWIGEGHRKIRDRTQTTVWQIDREGDYQHPTQKPVALISKALRNSTVRDDFVLDPFVGSGTTLIACEQLGRRCFAMEVEPKYCDVVIRRWEICTGNKARLMKARKHRTSEEN